MSYLLYSPWVHYSRVTANDCQQRQISHLLRIFDQSVLRVYCILLCLFFPSGLWAQEPAEPFPEKSVESSEADTIALQRKPAWEVGVGAGYFSGFDYPASKDENRRFIALPFFVIRTPLFRLGDGGIRAVAIENQRLKLDMSVGGSLNSSTSGKSARAGMPDLDFLFEFGPQLELRLYDRVLATGGQLQARFTSEVRAVFVTDFKQVQAQGVIAELGLGLNYRNVKGSGIDLYSAIDASYANEKLQDYFYEVSPEFVTPSRPLYDAKGGFLKSRVLLGVGLQVRKNLRVFLGTFVSLHSGASNKDSPLFETTRQTGFAMGLVWTIKTSKRRVEIVDLGSSN